MKKKFRLKIRNSSQIKKINDDASFRLFFRKTHKKKSILVYANKEKEKNLLIYDSINKLLLKNGIIAPKLYSQNYQDNYIEIEDFGDETLFKKLKNEKDKIRIFKKAIRMLCKIQKIKSTLIKDFKGKNYRVPLYTKKLILKEAQLFCDWYIPQVVSRKKKIKINKKLKGIFKKLLSFVKYPNDTFVHRDFHASNLMYLNKTIGLIDSQDALIGNKAYDLASFIDDVRFKTSNKLKNLLYNYYLTLNKGLLKKNDFKNDFEILSVLRNLKIIGIFTRLAIRDNKKKYLKLLPYAWKLIELRVDKNNVFNDLKKILGHNLKIKMKIVNEN